MVLSPPSQDTFTVGEKLTAALMNKNVRDAVTFLASPPLAVLLSLTNQSIPNSTFTSIQLSTTNVDTYNGHSNTSNNSRYTAAVAGNYSVSGAVSFANNTSGRRLALLAVNGTALPGTQVEVATVQTTGGTSVPTSIITYLNVGDYIELQGFQSSGAALNATGQLSILWVHV